jgi:hypothetical protein
MRVIPADGAEARVEQHGIVESSPDTSVVEVPKTPAKPRPDPQQAKQHYDSWSRASEDLAFAKQDHLSREAVEVKEWLRQKLVDTPLGTPGRDKLLERFQRAHRAEFEMENPGENRLVTVAGIETPEETAARELYWGDAQAVPKDTADTVPSFSWSNGQELSPALYSDWLDLFTFASAAKNYQQADKALRPFLEHGNYLDAHPEARIHAGTVQAEDFLNDLFKTWDEDPRVYEMNLARFHHAFTHFANPTEAMRLAEEKGLNFSKEFVLGMIELDRRMEKRAAKGETRNMDPQATRSNRTATRSMRFASLWRCPACSQKFLSGELKPTCRRCGALAVLDGRPEPPPSEPVDSERSGLHCDVCGAAGTLRQHFVYLAGCLPDGNRRLCRPCLTARDAAGNPLTVG